METDLDRLREEFRLAYKDYAERGRALVRLLTSEGDRSPDDILKAQAELSYAAERYEAARKSYVQAVMTGMNERPAVPTYEQRLQRTRRRTSLKPNHGTSPESQEH